MGFTRTELEAFEGQEVEDLIGPGLRLLFVGINPGLWTAAVQTHFAHPGNRFYPALFRAGSTEYEMDRSAGMKEVDRQYLISRGIGITNLVSRATAKASELSSDELREGGERLLRTVADCRPKVVGVVIYLHREHGTGVVQHVQATIFMFEHIHAFQRIV